MGRFHCRRLIKHSSSRLIRLFVFSMKTGDDTDQCGSGVIFEIPQSPPTPQSPTEEELPNHLPSPETKDGPGLIATLQEALKDESLAAAAAAALPADQDEASAQAAFDAQEGFSRFRSKSEGSALGFPRKSSFKKTGDPDLSKLLRRVSFADSNGFQLEQIRSFDIQQSSDLDDDEDFLLHTNTSATASRPRPRGERRFVPYFTLPWNTPSSRGVVFAALEDRKVCLESFTINSPWRISGTILVKNMSFHKRVFARRTLDKWQSHKDVDAVYVGSVNENVDRFHFELHFAFKLPPGTRLELALGYEVPQGKGQYWDNNCENNYAFWFNDKI